MAAATCSSQSSMSLARTPRQAKAELKQLQQERAEARDQALEAAADTHNLREAL